MSEKVQNQNIIDEIRELIKFKNSKERELFEKFEFLTKFIVNSGYEVIDIGNRKYIFIVDDYETPNIKYYEWRIDIEENGDSITIIGEIYNYDYESTFNYDLIEKLIEDLPKILEKLKECLIEEKNWIEEQLRKLKQVILDS